MTFIKSCSINSRNEQSPTCEVVHETNKAHFRNLLPNRFLPSSVGKALAWRSGGPGFKPHWGQFLTNFFCSSLCEDLPDNQTETPFVKNSTMMIERTIAWKVWEIFEFESMCSWPWTDILNSFSDRHLWDYDLLPLTTLEGPSLVALRHRWC